MPVAELVATFGDLVTAGLVRRYGVSNHPSWLVERIRAAAERAELPTVSAYQQRYSYFQPLPGVPVEGHPSHSACSARTGSDFLRRLPGRLRLGLHRHAAGPLRPRRPAAGAGVPARRQRAPTRGPRAGGGPARTAPGSGGVGLARLGPAGPHPDRRREFGRPDRAGLGRRDHQADRRRAGHARPRRREPRITTGVGARW